MPSGHSKKRSNEGRIQRPSKKQRRKDAYNSDTSDNEEAGFDPVNLLDSDDDIHNAAVDDGAADTPGELSSSEEEKEEEEDQRPAPKKKMALKATRKVQKMPAKEDEMSEAESSDDDDEEAGDSDADEDSGDDEDDDGPSGRQSKPKKRDNTAFATSLSKILSTKLSSSKRADPVLSRSIEAQEASRAVVDSALESKARKQLRDQKRRAFEKGRVKDVLVATRDETGAGGVETSTADIMETERRLRKVAQRGVVKLFNAVRAAQVAATEAEKVARKDGVIGMGRREEKVNELTKKSFLDLIASGGGGLKKGGLEEA
jgi:hypothetical protein